MNSELITQQQANAFIGISHARETSTGVIINANSTVDYVINFQGCRAEQQGSIVVQQQHTQ